VFLHLIPKKASLDTVLETNFRFTIKGLMNSKSHFKMLSKCFKVLATVGFLFFSEIYCHDIIETFRYKISSKSKIDFPPS
jgi:hypothetical protein